MLSAGLLQCVFWHPGTTVPQRKLIITAVPVRFAAHACPICLSLAGWRARCTATCLSALLQRYFGSNQPFCVILRLFPLDPVCGLDAGINPAAVAVTAGEIGKRVVQYEGWARLV